MRDYGKVYCRFWSSRDIRALSEDARTLALYLMTCGHCTLAGIFHLPNGYVCEDTQWPVERVTVAFAELRRKGFATRCDLTKWVWIIKHLEWNELENPNQAKAAAKISVEVDAECSWLPDFERMLREYISSRAKRLGNPFGTVPEPFPNPSPTVPQPGTGSGSGTGSGTGTGHTDRISTPDPVCAVGNGTTAPRPNGTNGHHEAEPEPEGFIQLKANYPPRTGDQRWSGALAYYLANLKAGITHEQMAEGVERYASYCQAEEITGTRYVQAAATFLGTTQGYLLPWKPGEKSKRESPGERWAREQEAKDAQH